MLSFMLGMAIPALAEYLGPDRTRTESHVETYDWGVWAKPDPTGNSCVHTYGTDCIVCTWERNPGSPCGDATYWYKVGERSEVVTTTVTYPEAEISGSLSGCTLRNGWCITSPSLSLSASEPVAGYQITLIEGTRNGEAFACNGAACEVPLLEGQNDFTFWALSSWGDSSRMGTLTARVDTRAPQVNGSLSGTMGENGWYVSAVTVSASAADPEPGSGLQALSYSLDGGSWTAYTAPLVVEDGIHSVVFRAQDGTGHVSEASVTLQVDTLPPQVSGVLTGEVVNGWYVRRAEVVLQASDATSGVARVEYALDSGSWQPYTAPLTVGDGVHTLRLRAFDLAGNVAEGTPLSFRVDGSAPQVRLADWYIWESGALRVVDGESGLSGVDVEIRDPQGRWPKVSWEYDAEGERFERVLVWDRRFGDGTLAPVGRYEVRVKAFDLAGNMGVGRAWVIIPPPQATVTPLPTSTPEQPTFTPTAVAPFSLFSVQPTATVTPTAAVSGFQSFGSSSPPASSPPVSSASSPLWGVAALAAAAGATAYVLERRRRRKEEEAAQAAEARAKADRLNTAEFLRKVENWKRGHEAKQQGAVAADEPLTDTTPPSRPPWKQSPYPDPETADMTEAERRREYMASAEYQEYRRRMVEWEQRQRYARFHEKEVAGYNALPPQPTPTLACTPTSPTTATPSQPWWKRAWDGITATLTPRPVPVPTPPTPPKTPPPSPFTSSPSSSAQQQTPQNKRGWPKWVPLIAEAAMLLTIPTTYISLSAYYGSHPIGALLGTSPDWRGIKIVQQHRETIEKEQDYITARGIHPTTVAASIAVQSQWNGFPVDYALAGVDYLWRRENASPSFGIAQLTQKELDAWGIEGTPFEPDASVKGITERIAEVVNACTKCNDTDKLILAAVAQNGGIGKKGVSDLMKNFPGDHGINWESYFREQKQLSGEFWHRFYNFRAFEQNYNTQYMLRLFTNDLIALVEEKGWEPPAGYDPVYMQCLAAGESNCHPTQP